MFMVMDIINLNNEINTLKFHYFHANVKGSA